MKKIIFAFVLTAVALAATTATAQGNFTMRADVPMSFSANGQHYAAGSYELRTVNNSNIVQLQNTKSGHAGLIMIESPDLARGGRSSAEPVLRFGVDGERAFLISLTNADGITWKVPVAKRDLEASRKAKSIVAVALK